jgi:hypothetical protein
VGGSGGGPTMNNTAVVFMYLDNNNTEVVYF